MPDDALKPALRAALRFNEIGTQSPFQLSFAAKGKSGASFGFMQGDLAAGQAEVTKTFRAVLAAAGFAQAKIDALAAQLSVPHATNPLSKADTDAINAALVKSSALVDAMDETILAGVYGGLDKCISAATKSGRTIAGEALIFMALWINMTGPPSKLLTYLQGGDPGLSKPIPKAGNVVDGPAMDTYLGATDFFVKNPKNLKHMRESQAIGAAQLPH